MSWWKKVQQIGGKAADVGKVVGALGVPGVGTVASIVDKVIEDPDEPHNVPALRTMASEIDTLKAEVSWLKKELAALKQYR